MDARSRSNGGFTLIEVVFAVLILAGSLVVLLGLQTSSLQLTGRDKMTQQAMLYARRILSPIETSKEGIDIQDEQGSVKELMQKFIPGDSSVDTDTTISPAFRARLKVEHWGIPKVNEEAMKRLTLTISWGESTDERFEVVYFMPNDGDVAKDPEGEL